MTLGRRRGSVAELTLLVAAFGVSLALAEGVARLVRPPAASRIRYPCFYVPDERLGFRYRPHARGRVAGHFEIDHVVALNSLGFYDDEPRVASAGLRVLAVGDSFTAAMNVARSQVWTSLLEAELRRRGHPRADVVNLGIDGTGTDVQLELLREYVPRFRPQVVLVAFFANDPEDVRNGRFARECYRDYVLSYQTEPQRDALRARVDAQLERRVLRWLFERSFLVRLALVAREGPATPFRLEFLQPSRAALGLTPELQRRRARLPRASFEALAQFATDCDCGLLLVPVPARRELGASLGLARGLAAGLPLPVVDVLPGMRTALAAEGRAPSDLFFAHDAHLNAYGNREFARALADAVVWPAAADEAAAHGRR